MKKLYTILLLLGCVATAFLKVFSLLPVHAQINGTGVGVQYWAKDNGAWFAQFLNEWPNHNQEINDDLEKIRNAGFSHVRILISPQHYGDIYMSWGQNGRKFFFQNQGSGANEFSETTPFAPPTSEQMKHLEDYISLVRSKGMDVEFVFALQSGEGLFYSHNETDDHYEKYLYPFFDLIKRIHPRRVFISGDADMANKTDHSIWHQRMWSKIIAQCPINECNLGVEIRTQNATLWDMAELNIQWIRNNLQPLPKYVGVQFYPTTRTWLCSWGYVQGYSDEQCSQISRSTPIIIDWQRLADDFWSHVNSAANGQLRVDIDEIGLHTTDYDIPAQSAAGFTEQDQNDFFLNSIPFLSTKTENMNIWTFDDNLDSGTNFEDFYGIFRKNGTTKPSYATLRQILPPITGNPKNPRDPDLNNDGVVNIFDYNAFLSPFNEKNVSVADVNNDGSVTIEDLNALLRAFTP